MRVVETSRQARRSEDSRRRILAHAAALVARNASLSVDAVCRAAGCSKGGFYHHFSDRSQLLIALAADASERLASDAQARPEETSLLACLWPEAARRPLVRRHLRRAVLNLSISTKGAARRVDAPADPPQARLLRLLALGRLTQQHLWAGARPVADRRREAIASAV